MYTHQKRPSTVVCFSLADSLPAPSCLLHSSSSAFFQLRFGSFPVLLRLLFSSPSAPLQLSFGSSPAPFWLLSSSPSAPLQLPFGTSRSPFLPSFIVTLAYKYSYNHFIQGQGFPACSQCCYYGNSVFMSLFLLQVPTRRCFMMCWQKSAKSSPSESLVHVYNYQSHSQATKCLVWE